MRLPTLDTIQSKEEARDYAITRQQWASEQDLSYGLLLEWQDVFKILGKRFNLTEEFEENGIL